MRTPRALGALALVAAIAAGCSTGATATAAPTANPTPVPSAAPTAAPATPAPTPAPTLDACAKDNLALKNPGKLTIGADNPAYPPYFARRPGGNTPPWEESDYTGDPTTGEGFEGAVAYAVADKLGFTKDQVGWIPVPFTNSFAPGAKDFDFYLTQVSHTPERAKAVDMSDGYYHVSQAVVALKGSKASKATSLSELKDLKLGAQALTTSYQAIQDVIKPTTDTQAFDSNDLAIKALKSGQIDALVVDLPTSYFITTVQIPDGAAVTVGRFENSFPEYFSLVLEKDSKLTPCVNAAVKALTDAGTLTGLASKWLPFQDTVPTLKP
jgi:polar amino acid transport system substrate-binding protein